MTNAGASKAEAEAHITNRALAGELRLMDKELSRRAEESARMRSFKMELNLPLPP